MAQPLIPEGPALTEASADRFQQIYLGVLVIQPSPFCNINCDYCYLPHRTSKTRMTMPILRQVMERVWESGLVGPPIQILWHAGEPLAVPLKWYEEAFALIADFPGAGDLITHSFQSNGTLLNEAWCRFIREHRVEIGLSIDGPAFIHDHHRKTRQGQGTHEKAMRGARLLQAEDIPFGVVAVISDVSLGYPDEIFDFFVELGIEGVGFNIEEEEGSHAHSSLTGTPEERVRTFLQRIFDRNREAGFPLHVREFEIARENIMDPLVNRGPDGTYYNLETNPLAMVNVDCHGDFSTFSPELLGQETADYGSFQFGNLLHDSLFSATQRDNFRKIHDDIRAGNEKCAQTCAFWSVCGGASPSNKYYENGTFNSAETRHCRSMIQVPMRIVLDSLEEELGIR